MSLKEFFKNIRGFEKLSEKSQMMLIAFYLRKEGQADFLDSEIAALHLEAGFTTTSIGAQLAKHSRGRGAPFVKVEAGRYSLSADGVEEVETYLREIGGLQGGLETLLHLVGQVAPEAEANFLQEVRDCIRVGARRSIVVMTWLLTVDHLQRHVVSKHLAAFNKALQGRTEYSRHTIALQDDFDEIRKEIHFVELLSSAGIVTRDMKKILEEKLDFRNTCAHPNSITLSDAKVVAFIEDLVHNIILKTPL